MACGDVVGIFVVIQNGCTIVLIGLVKDAIWAGEVHCGGVHIDDDVTIDNTGVVAPAEDVGAEETAVQVGIVAGLVVFSVIFYQYGDGVDFRACRGGDDVPLQLVGDGKIVGAVGYL